MSKKNLHKADLPATEIGIPPEKAPTGPVFSTRSTAGTTEIPEGSAQQPPEKAPTGPELGAGADRTEIPEGSAQQPPEKAPTGPEMRMGDPSHGDLVSPGGIAPAGGPAEEPEDTLLEDDEDDPIEFTPDPELARALEEPALASLSAKREDLDRVEAQLGRLQARFDGLMNILSSHHTSGLSPHTMGEILKLKGA